MDRKIKQKSKRHIDKTFLWDGNVFSELYNNTKSKKAIERNKNEAEIT